jgi:formylmethanofuran dehydrogenase subunit D
VLRDELCRPQKIGCLRRRQPEGYTEFGEVVVFAKAKDGNPEGLAFIPMGLWANAVLSPDTHGCGMPGFKGVPAEIDVTDEKPLETGEKSSKNPVRRLAH